jgi:hypothetical protein
VVAALGALLAVTAALAACGGDDADDTPTPTATPAGSPAEVTPDPASKTAGIEAMRAYLETEGLDGKKGAFTDPVDCVDLPDDFDGDFCVVDDASVYAPGLVILFVVNAEKQDEEAWEVHLKPSDGAWQVTEVEEVPSAE